MSKLLAIALAAGLLWSTTTHDSPGDPAQQPAAAHISAADILATIGNAPAGRVSDQQIRHIDAGGQGGIDDGESRDVGPGDMVIIPADSPHGFSEITETITYIVVRVDPEQLVELK